MDVPVRFIDSIINNPLLMQFLVHRWFFLLEYDPRLDQLRVYDTRSRTNARGTDFLREIVHLVKRLGFNVICEGIETEEQVQLLRSLDCDGAQGFWFSKAIPTEEFERRYLCN